jgi:hypothetical protein
VWGDGGVSEDVLHWRSCNVIARQRQVREWQREENRDVVQRRGSSVSAAQCSTSQCEYSMSHDRTVHHITV